GFVTLVGPADSTLTNVHVVSPMPPDAPAGVTFPVGLFRFMLRVPHPGDAADVTVLLPAGGIADSYVKFGAPPGDPAFHWSAFDYDGTTGATSSPGRVVLRLVDGQRGDSDLTANGVIVDPGGPVLVPKADLAVTARLRSATAVVGQPLTYTLTVTNTGPATA